MREQHFTLSLAAVLLLVIAGAGVPNVFIGWWWIAVGPVRTLGWGPVVLSYHWGLAYDEFWPPGAELTGSRRFNNPHLRMREKTSRHVFRSSPRPIHSHVSDRRRHHQPFLLVLVSWGRVCAALSFRVARCWQETRRRTNWCTEGLDAILLVLTAPWNVGSGGTLILEVIEDGGHNVMKRDSTTK